MEACGISAQAPASAEREPMRGDMFPNFCPHIYCEVLQSCGKDQKTPLGGIPTWDLGHNALKSRRCHRRKAGFLSHPVKGDLLFLWFSLSYFFCCAPEGAG